MPEVCTVQCLTALIIYRASQQLAMGHPPLISEEEVVKLNYDFIKIAELEIKRGLVSFSTKIKKPNGEFNLSESSDMIFN